MSRHKTAVEALTILQFQINHARATVAESGFDSRYEREREVLDDFRYLSERVDGMKANVLLMAQEQGEIEFKSVS